MSLIEHDLFRGCIDKVAMAIERMKAFEPEDGYYLAYSGGKDSDTILALAKMAGVQFDAHFNRAMEPPEVIYHIRKHPEVSVHLPKETLWKMIVRKRMPPTRLVRYCCELLKEGNGSGRLVMTGIRAEESHQRSRRNMSEKCYKDTSITYLHPIIDWAEEDVWEFLKGNNIEYCSLYDEGIKRVGCVMCPYGDQKSQAKRWPKIAEAWHRAILRCFDAADAAGLTARARFKDGEEMWQWWLSGKGKTEDGGLFT